MISGKTKFHEIVKSRKPPSFVIPVPHPVRGKLQPESSLFKHLRKKWAPVLTGLTTFYDDIEFQQ
jgi:hypothetical protein